MTTTVEKTGVSQTPAGVSKPAVPAVLPARNFEFWMVLNRLFKFFASLQLALFILFSLMAALAAGTIIESMHGTDAARILVYQAKWFNVLLCLLGINVTSAALDRYPWKVKHAGFVITHCGIVLILLGSFITQKTMIDGQIAIREGETESLITIPDPLLYIVSENMNRHWIFPLHKRPFPWTGSETVGRGEKSLPVKISVITDYPKAKLQEKIIPQEQTGPSAAQITLHNSFVDETQWIVENDPDRSELQIGPAKLKFTEEWLEPKTEKVPDTGYLEFQFKEKTVQVPLVPDLKLPATFPLEGTPYQITVTRIFKNAAIVDRDLVDQPDNAADASGDKNPAAELTFEGEGIKEKHITFSKYPEFPTQHGMKPSAAGMRVFYRFPNQGSRGESHEIRFVKKEDGLYYQIRKGFDVKSGKVEAGVEVPTGWMGNLTFKVENFYPHSKKEKTFLPEANTSTSEETVPAIRIRMEKGNEQKTLWLGQGIRETLEIAGDKFEMMYGQKRIPAGFRLQLRDFKIEKYPGTERPASFESDVTLKDDSRGISRDVTISMNEPLTHRGFSIYQSGYQQPEGEPEISIFSAARDPGVPIKYLGAIVMVAGTILMFYTRKFSTTPGKLI